MKVDNILSSVINGVNTPVLTPGNENAAVSQKQADTTVPEKDQDTWKASAENVAKDKLNKAIDVANNAFKDVNISFKYLVNQKTNREVVQVINTDTKEVIKQYPPEEIVNMLERMYDMLGILIDKHI
jgi:flagellar protein FlaG